MGTFTVPVDRLGVNPANCRKTAEVGDGGIIVLTSVPEVCAVVRGQVSKSTSTIRKARLFILLLIIMVV